MIRYADYEGLKNKAVTPLATQDDIDNLLDWFMLYGEKFWNGEYFDCNDGFKVYLPTERYNARISFNWWKKGS